MRAVGGAKRSPSRQTDYEVAAGLEPTLGRVSWVGHVHVPHLADSEPPPTFPITVADNPRIFAWAKKRQPGNSSTVCLNSIVN